jgi:hypothetical protein
MVQSVHEASSLEQDARGGGMPRDRAARARLGACLAAGAVETISAIILLASKKRVFPACIREKSHAAAEKRAIGKIH